MHWHGMAWYDMAWHGLIIMIIMVLYGMVWYNKVVVLMVVLTSRRGSGLMVNVQNSRSRGSDSCGDHLSSGCSLLRDRGIIYKEIQ